jgi:predicted dehydrogenase
MKKIRIGVLGCAQIAERMMIPAIKAIEDADLVAVASRTKEKADYFSEKFSCQPICGYENLLQIKEIDAVYIPLPTGLREEWILKALDAGKHVLSEKSLAMDFGSACKIIERAKKYKLVVIENYMFQYHSQHSFVRKLVGQGEIGEIRVFRSSFGFPPLGMDTFRYNPLLGGGALLEAGGYPVKAMQIYLGEDLELGGAFLHYDDHSNVDILGGAIFRNAKGEIAQIAFGFDNYYQCNYELWGSKGKITVERAFTPPPGFTPKVYLEKQNYKQEFVLPADNHFMNVFEEFMRAISEKDFKRHWNEALRQAEIQEKVRKGYET